MKQGKIKKYSVLLLLLFMGIGFAYLSVQFSINGFLGYSANKWDVHLDDVEIVKNQIGAETPVIDNNKTSVSFGGTFKKPGDVFEFTFDVVNAGTINAMLGEIDKNEDVDAAKYVKYSVTYSDGTEIKANDLLAKGNRVAIKVKVEYRTDIDEFPTLDAKSYSISMNYVKANDNANFVEGTFVKAVGSGNITITNAEANSMYDFRLYGNTVHNVYEGKNLYNVGAYNNREENNNNGYSISTENSGWIYVWYNNSTSETKDIYIRTSNLNLDSSKQYSVVLEIDYVNGTGTLFPTSTSGDGSGQLVEASYAYSSLSRNDVKIYPSSVQTPSGDIGLNTLLRFSPGESGDIRFRISVIEGTNITTDNFSYEPYVGEKASPSMEYPQAFNSVSNWPSINVKNKNMFRGWYQKRYYTNEEAPGDYINDNSNVLTINSSDENNVNFTLKENESAYVMTDLWMEETGDYTISFNVSATNESNTVFYVYGYNNSDNTYPILYKKTGVNGKVKYTFTISGSNNRVMLAWGGLNNSASNTINVKNIQLEKGTKATKYVASEQERYRSISLSSISLNKIGDSRDYIYDKDGTWYIHQEVGKYTFTGSETITKSSTTDNNVYIYNQLPNAKKNGEIQSTIFLAASASDLTSSNVTGIGLDDDGAVTFGVGLSGVSTVVDFNDLLSNYSPIVYYELEAPIEAEITDSNLLENLNSLYQNFLFEGTNNFRFYSDVTTQIEFKYKVEN